MAPTLSAPSHRRACRAWLPTGLALTLAAALWAAPPASAGARLLGPVPRVVTPAAPAPAPLRAQSRAAFPTASGPPPCSPQLVPALDFTGCYQQLVNRFLVDLAADSAVAVANGSPMMNAYGVTDQYGNGMADTGRNYGYSSANTVVVQDAWPADASHGNADGCQWSPGPDASTYDWCLTDAQVQTELSSVLAARGWPADLNSAYLMMLPARIDECSGPFARVQDANPCADLDFCAYHSNFSDPSTGAQTPPLYAVIPWPDVAGCQTHESPNGYPAADYGIDLVSHEQNEMVTDPLGNAWYDGSQDESADKCVGLPTPPDSAGAGTAVDQMINGHGYWIQDEFANTDPASGNSDVCEPQPGGPVDPAPTDMTGPLLYHLGPTMHTVNAYAIYWDGHPGSNPTAAIAAAPAAVHRGDTASFQAGPAADPQGQATTYAWSFGDGTSASGAVVTHAYQVSGTVTVTLTVTDADGYQASATRSVRVYAPPTASFTVTPHVVAGTAATFNAAASADPDGTITTWSWRFGDGATSSGAHTSHTFAHAGVYNATLTLTDSHAGTASETTTVVVVARRTPELATRGSPRTARAGSRVLLALRRTLGCTAGSTPCLVTLSITTTDRRRTVNIGLTSFTTRPGTSTALSLRLSASGQRLLRRVPRLTLTAHILVRLEGAPTLSRRLHATVSYPPRPSPRR